MMRSVGYLVTRALFAVLATFVAGCSSSVRIDDSVVNQIIENGPIDLVKGKVDFANSGEVSIWYEIRSPDSAIRGTVVLIMGISQTSMLWPEHFMQPLLDAGYRVIRFDNRDVGLSTWTDNSESSHPYSLADMGNDAIAILDQEGIDKAHFVGLSMGGVITQQIVVRHPLRVSSFTSLNSMPVLEPVPTKLLLKMIWPTLLYGWQKNELSEIKYDIALHALMNGNANHPLDIERHANRVVYEIRHRNGRNPAAIANQGAALAQEDANKIDLSTITAPTLIIHGRLDPAIPFDVGGPATAKLIPHADTLWIEDMGHGFSEAHSQLITEALISHFEPTTTGAIDSRRGGS